MDDKLAHPTTQLVLSLRP